MEGNDDDDDDNDANGDDDDDDDDDAMDDDDDDVNDDEEDDDNDDDIGSMIPCVSSLCVASSVRSFLHKALPSLSDSMVWGRFDITTEYLMV